MYYFYKENLLNKTKYENLDLSKDVHLALESNTKIGNVIACEVEVLTDDDFYQTNYRSKLLTVLDGICPYGYDYKRTLEVRIATTGDEFYHLDRSDLSLKLVITSAAFAILSLPFMLEFTGSSVKVSPALPVFIAASYVTNDAIKTGIFDPYLHNSIYDTAVLCAGPAVEGELSCDY